MGKSAGILGSVADQINSESGGTMILKNGEIFDRNFDVRKADVSADNGTITQIAPELNGKEALDVSGCLVAPGFVDIHCKPLRKAR